MTHYLYENIKVCHSDVFMHFIYNRVISKEKLKKITIKNLNDWVPSTFN